MHNTEGNKLFKSGKVIMTVAATLVFVSSTTIGSVANIINADTTNLTVAEHHSPINWKANDSATIANNFSDQKIKSIDQLGSYKVVWGDTLSGIAEHFNTTVEKIAADFNITNKNFIVAGIKMSDQHLYNNSALDATATSQAPAVNVAPLHPIQVVPKNVAYTANSSHLVNTSYNQESPDDINIDYNEASEAATSSAAASEAAASSAAASLASAQSAAAAAESAAQSAAQAAQDKAKVAAQAAQDKANADAKAAKAQADKDAQAKHDADIAKQEKANADSEKAQQDKNTASEKAAQKTVDQAQYTLNHGIKPATPGKSDTNHSVGDEPAHTIDSEAKLPTSIQDPKISPENTAKNYFDYYGYNSKNDTSAKIGADGPTDKQQQELADYAYTLLANYQRDHGREPIAWTKESQEYAVFIANLRKKYNMNFEHTSLYNDAAATAINKYNEQHHAVDGGENLGMMYINSNTMLEIKVGLLNAMTAMIYQDEASGNGHLANFMNTRDGQSFGFSVQRFIDTYNLVWSFNTVHNFNDATFLTSTAQSDIEDLRGGDTTKNRQKLADAKQALADIKAANAQALAQLKADNAQKLTDVKTQADKTLSQAKQASAQQLKTSQANAQTAHDNAIKTATDKYNASVKAAADKHTTANQTAQANYDKQILQNAADYKNTINSITASNKVLI